MKKLLLVLLMATSMFAAECKYTLKSVDVDWKAYKTPLKLGVGGTFDKVSVEAKEASSQEALLKTASVNIQTSSVNSKNSGRDAKLVKFFFDVQNVKNITAKVISVAKDVVTVAVSMNGLTKEVPMKLKMSKDEIKANGYIDLADFTMLPSLKNINKACYALHKGKTWQDVAIEFELKTQKSCE
ncbi:YceI family protein [Sulfurimonas sp.]